MFCRKLESCSSNDLQHVTFTGLVDESTVRFLCSLTRASCLKPQPSCDLSPFRCVVLAAGAWSRASNQGFFCSSLHIYFGGSGGRNVSSTLIFYFKNTTNTGSRRHACGDEHKCFIHPFMNHALHLGRRLVFCSFSGVCALFLCLRPGKSCAKRGLGWLELLFVRAR